mmetsp:Transcript_6785/g.12841  ORF Transcript_6785/g.12841 Transcript_6785/m.12841 type:complete len:144 (-) Transcript_6785:1561-1992(-)
MVIPLSEVAKHNKKSDCWIAVHGKVYDLTKFAHEHPGGSHILFNLAGKDGSRIFDTIHTPDIFDGYKEEVPMVGELDPKDIKQKDESAVKKGEKPPLEYLLNAFEFEQVQPYIFIEFFRSLFLATVQVQPRETIPFILTQRAS